MRRLAFIFLALLLLLPRPAWAKCLQIALIDTSTPVANSWTDDNYSFAQAALQNQLNTDSSWHKEGFCVQPFRQKGAASRYWRVFIRNKCIWADGNSYPAFHWFDGRGIYACVASVGGGGYWWMTRAMEHEAVEMIADPSGAGIEVVEPVARFFGAVCDGVFTFDYNSCIGLPFVDFLLPKRQLHGFKDYLQQVKKRQ